MRAGPILCCLLASACSAAPPPAAVRFNIAADPATLNPLFAHPDAASVELQLARLSFEPFVDLDARGRPVPALLENIPSTSNGGISADGRTITYRLRRGLTWSDGVPVTAHDAAWTLGAILDTANPVRSHAGYERIDAYRAVNDRTLVVHLRRPWAPAVLSFFSYGGPAPQFVLPQHVLAKQRPLRTAAFGSLPTVVDGPFRPVQWKRGEALRYEANPRYYRGVAHVPALQVRIVTDPSSNLVMLQTGASDWNLVAPVQMASLNGKGLRFTTTPTSVVAGLALNTARAPLNEVSVRRALALSIDRNAISAKITLGKYPVTDQLQPQFSWAYDARVRQPAYDPARADEVLDAAGWRRGPDGFRRRAGRPLELTYVQFPESMTGVRVAAIVQASLRERGIGVAVKSISNAQLFLPVTGTLAKGDFDMAYVPWTMGADPDDSAVLSCGGAENYMRWCDPQVDALERDATADSDRVRRAADYRRIASAVADAVPVLYLFNARYIYAYRPRLAGFAPNAFLPTWNAWEWAAH